MLYGRPRIGGKPRALKPGEAANVVDYGADPTGNDDNTAQAFKRALAASKSILIPSGTYNFGDVAGGILCDLAPFGDNIAFQCGQDVIFFCNTTRAQVSAFFGLNGNNNFTCGPVHFRDDGYDPLVDNHGADGFSLYGGASAWGNVNIASIHATRCHAPIEIVTPHRENRVSNVRIGKITADDCYYGFVAANQGDDVTIDQIIAYQTRRAYYAYGVVRHRAKILNRNPRFSSGAVNIARQVGGYDTSDISVDYTARDVSVDITHVVINHIDLRGGVISDIRVQVDIEGTVPYWPVRFVNFTKSGGAETRAPSPNVVDRVYIGGSCDARARPVEVVATYAGKGLATFRVGPFLRPAQSLSSRFNVR